MIQEKYIFISRKAEKKEIVYGHDIPCRYNVDKRIYRQLLRELTRDIVGLYNEYKENNEEVWTNLTFILDNKGKFNIKYNYDDVLNCGFSAGERQIIWEYEILNIEPKDEEYREMMQKYLEIKNKYNYINNKIAI